MTINSQDDKLKLMPENLDELSKRVRDLETRVSFLESEKQVAAGHIPQESKQKVKGFSIPSVISGIIGIIILFNFLPSLFVPTAYGYYRSQNYILGFLGVGLVLFAVRSLFSSKKVETEQTTQQLQVKPSGSVAEPILEKHKESDFEFNLAANWFAIVGIVAIVFAVVFFLKYAFDNGLIGPVGQVIIGLIFGITLIFTGEFLRQKVHRYSQVISSGGIAVLYLSIWAAWGLFNLISPIATLSSISVITVLSSLLAIRYEAVYIAVLGVIGGFATPILLGKGFDSQIFLMSYVVVLNVGVLGISFFKNWRELNVATFGGTYIVIISWIAAYWKPDKLTITLFFLTLIFLIFAISLFIYNFVYKKEAEESDIILMLANAIVYFGLGYYLITDAGFKDFVGFFAFALSAFYFVLGSFSYQKFKENSYLTLGFLGISIFFLTIAVPLQVKNNLITIVWAIEAVSLLLLGFLISSQKLRVAALLIYILVFVRLFGFDTQIDISKFVLIFNMRFLTFILSAISMGLASYLYAKYGQNLNDDEKKILPVILIAANVLLIWAFSWESISYYARRIEQVNKARLQSTQTDIRVLGMRIAQGVDIYNNTHPAYPATGSGQIEKPPNNFQPNYNYPSPTPYNRNIPRSVAPRPNNNYQPPKSLSSQDLAKIKDLESSRDISLSVIWLLYSVTLLAVGFAAKYKPVRLFALGFLILTIIKVFLYDSRSLQQGYRIVAFMILGTMLLATSFVYQKYKTQISSFLLNDK